MMWLCGGLPTFPMNKQIVREWWWIEWIITCFTNGQRLYLWASRTAFGGSSWFDGQWRGSFRLGRCGFHHGWLSCGLFWSWGVGRSTAKVGTGLEQTAEDQWGPGWMVLKTGNSCLAFWCFLLHGVKRESLRKSQCIDWYWLCNIIVWSAGDVRA